MRDTIILTSQYEMQLVHEAQKEGLIKEQDDLAETDFSPSCTELDNELYELTFGTATPDRQKLFQMMLLYDNVILESAPPLYDYDKLESSGNIKVYTTLDFLDSIPIKSEKPDAFAEYLKPALINSLCNDLRGYFPNIDSSDKTYNECISFLYDCVFGLPTFLSDNAAEMLKEAETDFLLRRCNIRIQRKEPGFPKALIGERLGTVVAGLIQNSYERLCWQLEICNKKDAYILNSEFQLNKIGCNNYREDNLGTLEAYQILKCECQNIIGTLPIFSSMSDVFRIKEKRRQDVYRLREVLSNLENVLRTDGRERTIIQASEDVKKASIELSRGCNINKVGTWTTILSLPVGIVENLTNLGEYKIGIGLSAAGVITLLSNYLIDRNNRWCEIVR